MPFISVYRDAATASFFDGTAHGEFLLLRDTRTGQLLDPRTETSHDPGRYEHVPASGRGTVASWSAPHSRAADGSSLRVLVGIVQLAEGPWFWTQLRDFAAEEDPMGAPVVVGFEKSGADPAAETVPYFMKA